MQTVPFVSTIVNARLRRRKKIEDETRLRIDQDRKDVKGRETLEITIILVTKHSKPA
jgi:hypothetical protein